MNAFMTIDEVLSAYPDEWVLLDELETGEHEIVKGGRVIGHDPVRTVVETMAIQMQLPRCAVVCAKLRDGEPVVGREYAVSPITSFDEIEAEMAKSA